MQQGVGGVGLCLCTLYAGCLWMLPTQLLCACANGSLQQVFQQCMAGELWQQATVGSAASLHSLAWKRPAAGWVASCCAGALLLSRPLTAAVTP